MIIKEDYNVKVYRWEFEGMGLFEATFKDGKLTDLRFCRRGSDLSMFTLFTTDLGYLRAIHEALSQLFDHLDKKRL